MSTTQPSKPLNIKSHAIAIADFSIDEYTKKEVKIGDVKFYFDDMPGVPAWDLFEEIRDELFKQNIGYDLNDILMNFQNLMAKLPRKFVRERLLVELGPYIRYKGPGMEMPQELDREERLHLAFKRDWGVEPIAITVVIARSICVNFTPSFRDIFRTMFVKTEEDQSTNQ